MLGSAPNLIVIPQTTSKAFHPTYAQTQSLTAFHKTQLIMGIDAGLPYFSAAGLAYMAAENCPHART
jgi:hypothetical protein